MGGFLTSVSRSSVSRRSPRYRLTIGCAIETSASSSFRHGSSVLSTTVEVSQTDINSCSLLIYAVYFTPLYLQNVRDFGIIESAALLLPLVLSQVITTLISGYAIKWTGRARTSFMVGFVVWAAGQGAQISFDQTTSNGVIIVCLLIQGLGIGATLQSSMSFGVRY